MPLTLRVLDAHLVAAGFQNVPDRALSVDEECAERRSRARRPDNHRRRHRRKAPGAIAQRVIAANVADILLAGEAELETVSSSFSKSKRRWRKGPGAAALAAFYRTRNCLPAKRSASSSRVAISTFRLFVERDPARARAQAASSR